MKDYNFNIILFWINKNYLADNFYISLLSFAVRESERSLFSFFIEPHRIEIDLIFFHFKFER